MSDEEEAPAAVSDTQGAKVDQLERFFASNLRTFRELRGFSQTALAQAMTDRGYPYRQQTVARIESGSRAIRLGEAVALTEILDTHIYVLVTPVGVQKAASDLRALTKRVETHTYSLESAKRSLDEAVAALEQVVRDAQKDGHQEALRTELTSAKSVLRQAYVAGRL